jgi:hypothetical protein
LCKRGRTCSNEKDQQKQYANSHKSLLHSLKISASRHGGTSCSVARR